MHWNSTVREMKKKVMKNEGIESELVELVYDRKKLYNRDKWYSTSLLGKEDIVLHLCKTWEHFHKKFNASADFQMLLYILSQS